MTHPNPLAISGEEHLYRHVLLHEYLDELIADFIRHTGKLPSRTTVLELMRWAAEQRASPTEES
jgi:hypothetical protein